MFYKIFSICILAFLICFGNIKAENLSNNDISQQFILNQFPEHMPEDAVWYTKEGRPVFLSSYKGKVVVLNFFKATCRKCLIEMPGLNELKDKYPNIVVLAVSQGDESADVIDRILHQERRLKNIEVSFDKKQKLFFSLGGKKVPQTHLIDKKGFIRGTIKGQADFRSSEISKQIEVLLSE